MRILVLAFDFPSEERPGAGIFILRAAQAVHDLGHDVSVLRIVPHAPPFGKKWRAYAAIRPAYEYEGIPVRTIRAFFPPRQIAMEFLPLQVHSAVRKEIERSAPDVLHANFLIPCGQVAVRQQVPTVVTAHGGDAYLWPHRRRGLLRAAREAVTKATRVTAVSNYIRRCVEEIAPREVDIIFNGADERHFHPLERAPARDMLSLPQDRLIIAFAGNIFRNKGVFDLIEAAAGIADLRPLVAFAGEGPHREQAEQHAAAARVETRFFGRLGSEDLGKLFNAADIVTLPSYNEGLPNVICEAMMCGRPIVATTVGGIPEIVRDARTGVLVPPGQPAQLRDAFARVAADRDLQSTIASGAREFAAANLTWRVSAKAYERAYAAALSVRH